MAKQQAGEGAAVDGMDENCRLTVSSMALLYLTQRLHMFAAQRRGLGWSPPSEILPLENGFTAISDEV